MLKPVAINLLVVALGYTVVACDTVGSLPQPAVGYYSKETLGELPESPDGSDSSKVVSLVQVNGDMPQYKLKVKSNIRAGKTMSCEIRAGEIIDAIAEKGSMFLVQAQRTSLARACENSGAADFVEGYIEKSVLEPVAAAQADASGQTVGTTETKPASPPAQTTTVLPEFAPTPMQTPMPTSVATAQCDSVKFGVSPKTDGVLQSQISFGRSMSGKANGIPGALWRSGGDNFLLAVTGSAEKWKVQAFNKSNKSKMDAVTLDNAKLKSKKTGEVIIPFKLFVKDPNSWFGASIEIEITAIDSQGAEARKSCTQKVNLLSPLVLDFSGEKMIRTLPVAHSGVEFDLDADGTKEQVGWIASNSSALLTVDLNNNGRVDDGRELFGDATLLSSTEKASNGFEALAHYDANSDGRIDSRDPVFQKLKLWFDRNGNGRSEANELVTLNSKKVKWISVTGQAIPRSEALQHVDALVPNDVRLGATFAADGCPKGICKVYDIFFGAVNNRVVTQK